MERFRLIAGGASAILIGIGLGRFAYTALLPAIIEAGWFTESQAAYLGAANLAGYLIGAVTAAPLAARIGGGRATAASVLAIFLSFALCAVSTPFWWFLVWRLLAGVAGALLMVIAPSAVLSVLAPEDRKTGAAYVFSGVGLGILLSATLVPALVAWSLTAAWVALAMAVALLAPTIRRGWRPSTMVGAIPGPGAAEASLPAVNRSVVAAILVAYGLDAVGFVPHTVFWVDYLAREAGYGTSTAGLFWALFGIGAVAGPFLAGLSARRIGWHGALVAGFAVKTVAVALPALSTNAATAVLSSLLVGALVPGMVALTSGRLAELVGPANHRKAWGMATGSFALAQAGAAYGFAALYVAAETYVPLFAAGATALFAGMLVLILASRPGSFASTPEGSP